LHLTGEVMRVDCEESKVTIRIGGPAIVDVD
jgi:hypothetical protein